MLPLKQKLPPHQATGQYAQFNHLFVGFAKQCLYAVLVFFYAQVNCFHFLKGPVCCNGCFIFFLFNINFFQKRIYLVKIVFQSRTNLDLVKLNTINTSVANANAYCICINKQRR